MKLHPIRGRNGYCGPGVISALTGVTTDEAAALLRLQTGRKQIRGVTPNELLPTLRNLGFWTERFQIFAEDTDLTLGEWLEVHTASWTGAYLITTQGHWQLVAGEDVVCSKNRVPINWRAMKKKWLADKMKAVWVINSRF
jgi:hypothetical protein